MSRRMIDTRTIIKSQIVDDKETVDLNEILEKYGTQDEYGNKFITLQIYSKQADSDVELSINDDTNVKGYIIPNSAITITKNDVNCVYIVGLIVGDLNNRNLLPCITINDGEYENGIILFDNYHFDVHVIKV